MARQRSFEERLAERLRSRKVEDAKLRARQAQGKIRRLINTNFRKQEMIEALALRRGDAIDVAHVANCSSNVLFSRSKPMVPRSAESMRIDRTHAAYFRLNDEISKRFGARSYYFIEKPVRLGKAS